MLCLACMRNTPNFSPSAVRSILSKPCILIPHFGRVGDVADWIECAIHHPDTKFVRVYCQATVLGILHCPVAKFAVDDGEVNGSPISLEVTGSGKGRMPVA
jgi:hypothetical protein